MREKSKRHLDYVRSLPCVICGDPVHTQAAHVRFADPRAAKDITGMGTKPSDEWTVPLCNRHHEEQHRGGEREFWRRHGIDPVFVAMALSRESGNYEAGCKIVASARLAA
jgi:hypothetical protein